MGSNFTVSMVIRDWTYGQMYVANFRYHILVAVLRSSCVSIALHINKNGM